LLCRLANNADDRFGFSRLPNITLYLSILTLGISTSSLGPSSVCGVSESLLSSGAYGVRVDWRFGGKSFGGTFGALSDLSSDIAFREWTGVVCDPFMRGRLRALEGLRRTEPTLPRNPRESGNAGFEAIAGEAARVLSTSESGCSVAAVRK